ncbi:MAG: RagB/SusD family nutrient uptake outer membrane protein, partial [Gammaproteobacteria bacterium]|nr:RagB/SusD family nutrient uptake outer membrane protein [Gammaproteobacteria bacterium]NIY08026.1 RagB/SusD family nutrient uptake outer membrane protein [Gemmatimonadota bacterium]
MTKIRMVPALLMVAALGACDEDLLDVLPQDEIAEDIAIVDEETAEAALMGVYSSFQSDFLYGGDYVIWTDLLSDDVEHTGTFGSYGQGDLINVPADNFVVEGMWTTTYEGINRANTVIQTVPAVDGIDAGAVDKIVGEAYALRALHYFDLVRAYGGVPVVLTPPASLDDIEELAQATRASAAEVWAQIEADLAEAKSRLAAAGVSNDERVRVTPGFVDALLAKAHLYQEDWAAAETAALAVVNSGDYDLAGAYGDLFEADGAPTAEDIFRIEFIATDANVFGYYYQFEGRFEVGATQEIYTAYDQATDARWAYSFDETRSDGIEVVKYPTTVGTEDFHVIRYAEVLLILAEAHAQQNELPEAVGYLNMVRTRAGLTGYDLATDLGGSQAQVLDAIYLERRLELAFEGERWFDLVRTDRAAAELGAAFSAHEA